MSDKERRRRKMARTVMFAAWKTFRRCLLSFGTCLRVSWKTVRCRLQVYHSKARGTSFGNRQEILHRLSRYDTRDIRLSFQREPENAMDPNAILIVATVRGRGSAPIGYIAQEMAAWLAPLMDEGHEVLVMLGGVTGTGRDGGHLGLNFEYIIL